MAAKELYYTSLLLDANCRAYYRCENGELLTDSKGSYTLSNWGSVGQSSSGQFGYCADFGTPNTTKLLYIDSDFGITSQTFSICCWLKTTVPTTNETFSDPVEMVFNGYGTFYIRFYKSGGVMYTGVIRNNGITQEGTYYAVDPGTGWNHYVMTCSGTNLKLYINKVDKGNNTCSTTAGGSNTRTNFGTGLVSAGYSGLMDDIMIFNDVLTGAEVTAIYDGTLANYFHQNNADTFTISDVPSYIRSLVKSFSDTFSISEGLTTAYGFIRSFADSFTISDRFVRPWRGQPPHTSIWSRITETVSSWVKRDPTSSTWTEDQPHE